MAVADLARVRVAGVAAARVPVSLVRRQPGAAQLRARGLKSEESFMRCTSGH